MRRISFLDIADRKWREAYDSLACLQGLKDFLPTIMPEEPFWKLFLAIFGRETE